MTLALDQVKARGQPTPIPQEYFLLCLAAKKWPNLVPATSEEGQRQDSLITNTCQISISQISVRVDLIWVSSLKEFHSSHRHFMNNHFGSNVLSLLVVFFFYLFLSFSLPPLEFIVPFGIRNILNWKKNKKEGSFSPRVGGWRWASESAGMRLPYLLPLTRESPQAPLTDLAWGSPSINPTGGIQSFLYVC